VAELAYTQGSQRLADGGIGTVGTVDFVGPGKIPKKSARGTRKTRKRHIARPEGVSRS
jgi:hypothetical protein